MVSAYTLRVPRPLNRRDTGKVEDPPCRHVERFPVAKIEVTNPVVELDGDEMTRIIWGFIRDRLIFRYRDIELECHTLGMES
jgi:hypothetical protein